MSDSEKKSKRSSLSANNTPQGSPVSSRHKSGEYSDSPLGTPQQQQQQQQLLSPLSGNYNAPQSLLHSIAHSLVAQSGSPLGSSSPRSLSHTNSSNSLSGGSDPGIRKHIKLRLNPQSSFLNIKIAEEKDVALPFRMTWNDFEKEYEKEYENIMESLRFPIGEVIVRRQEKIPRTVFSPTIGIVVGGLDYHIRELIDGFYKDYLIVEHRSSLSTTGVRKHSTLKASLILEAGKDSTNNSISPSNSFLNQNPSLKSKLFVTGKSLTRDTSVSMSAPDLGGYLSPTSASSASSTLPPLGPSSPPPTTHHRSNTNHHNQPHYQSHQHYTDPLKELIPERNGLELLCEMKELKFSMDIEPFFCSLYIVDLDKKERITESFNFHLNPKSLMDSLKMSDDLFNGWANQKKCKFNLNQYHPNIYFILRVYHVFRGDIEKDIKPYFKDLKKKTNDKQSILSQFKSEVNDKCTNWGSGEQNQILQPFVWAAYPVFHRPTLVSNPSSINLNSNFSPNSSNSSNSSNSPNISPIPSPQLHHLQQQLNQQINSLNINSNSSQSTPNTLSPPSVTPPPISNNIPTQPISSPIIVSQNGSSNNNSIPVPPPPPPHLNHHRRRSSFMSLQSSPSGNGSNGNGGMGGINTKITNTIEIVSMIPATPNLSDRTICEMLISDKDLKKLKPIPGSFVMSILTKESDEELKGRISPSLIPLLPIDTDKNPNLIREIQDFSEIQYPFVEYVNNLYIYPESVFIKYKNPNIQIQVQLIDDLQSFKALKCIYPNTPPYIPSHIWDTLNLPAPGVPGPTTTIPYPALDYVSFSSVNFHDKRPHFTEEFKIKLPTKITAQHHLLFTFYNVNIHAKKDIKTAIGYCAVPLCSGSKHGLFLRDDNYNVSIASELTNIESSTFLNAEEGKKEKTCIFSFRSKLVSSVITQDPCLDSFFKQFNNPTHDSLGKTMDSVKSILKIDRLTCVRFFPAILNQLFQIMCCSANEVASQAFSSILHIIKVVDGFQEKKASTEKSRLLTYYSEYLFDYVPDSKHLYEELCRQWVNSINTGIYVKDFRLNWFLFDIMTKSMALSLQPTGKLDSDLGRENRFEIEFQENLNKLVLKLIPSQSDGMSVQSWEFFTKFPYFINNLFPLIDRGFLFNLIYNYIARIDPANEDLTMVTIKFNFLKITTDYDHYIPLNFPLVFDTLDSVSDLNLKFFKRHFLSVLLISEVEGCLKQNKTAIRNQAIQTLKQLIKKHHYDPRYQQSDIREKVASIYFPYVLMLVEHYSIIKHQLELKEIQEWLTCFVWILQYCNRDLLRKWFQKETQEHQTNFLNLVMICLESFKDEPSIFEISLLSIDISRYILEDFNESSLSNSILLDIVINILQKCSTISGVEMMRLIFVIIKDFLIKYYPISLFQNLNNSYCEIVSYELLRSIDITDLLEESSSLFYSLLESNYKTTKDISKMKIQSTVAISRLVGEIKLENSNNLNIFLNKVMKETKNHESTIFITQVDEMIKRIHTLIKYSNTISANKNDPEMVSEMYYRISNSYFESPNLRLTWLENLSKIHTENQQFDEASQCFVHCAYLISRYLVSTGKFMDILESDFLSICPNIKNELVLPTFDQKDSGALFQSGIWSLTYVVELLEKAIALLETGNRYELAIEIYSLISKILKCKKDYKALSTCLANCQKLCTTLLEKNKDTRLFSRYYRIGFYGSKYEELDGKEYIYRKPHEAGLSLIQNQIKNNLQEKFGQSQEIIMLGNAKVDTSVLDRDKVYFQIVSVEPYFEQGEYGISQFDQYFNVSKFISEVPFSLEGKAIQDDMSKQQKKKTIFEVDLAFPYVKNRLEVVSKREIILSPIENAIELIKNRCIKLKEQLDTNPPRINPLHQIIQGSVVPMVNEGPLKVCEIFLSPKTVGSYNPEHVEQLKKAMEKFIIYCGFTIRLSRSLITVQLQDFQKMVEKQYEILKNQINNYLK
ncbi:hypothetical protein CYY_005696 [Polysphondylium violaceum]|uniref:DOCK family protein n=1 Tax=Polysphondylium violaceum TaxID=133409 RepID=A0A8J4PVX4_9MYCE|nr:hypothetical protein CYY_005696 [Polysphondylium violaceum]